MKKKAFILFVVILLSELLVGCYHHDDCNPEPQSLYLDNISCEIHNKMPTYQKDSLIIHQNYLELWFEVDIKNSNLSNHLNSIFLTKTYACSPNTILVNPATTFEIRCSHDILNTKAGDVIDNNMIQYASLSPIDDIVQRINSNSYNFSTLIFKEAIISDEYLIFDISVILEDGKKISTKTIPVKIIQ